MMAATSLDPDTALMLRVRDGDVASFDVLLDKHRSSVVHHLFRLVHNRHIAEELAQDVFVRVYRSRARYQPEARFTTWLFRITTNVALNWRRDSRHEAGNVSLDGTLPGALQLRDGGPGMDEWMVRQHAAREIRAAIQDLPAKQLAAVVLHKYEGMDYASIAEALNCSIPALKSILFRAYETLRRSLAHFAPAE